MRRLVEIELIDGKRTLIPNQWDKFYGMHERTKTNFKFSSKFPFISATKTRYVTFKYRTHYEYLDSIMDPRFDVNCTLAELARLFEVDFVPFEQTIVENDLSHHIV